MRKGTWAGRIAAFTMIVVGVATQARAQSVADFYHGKTLRMIIGYGSGGGYDIYGRLVAEFLPKHIPGAPTVITQNMPGGGSFVAAKYLADVAPKDGTMFGSLAQTLALDSIVGNTANIDVPKFHYLGRMVTNIDTGVALPKSGIKSFDDVRNKEYTVGASGGGSTTMVFPTALNTYAGAKFKIIRGYPGSTEIALAMEKGEVDIVGAYGLPGILINHPGWIDKGEAVILYQAALKRHPLLPNVPTLPELGITPEGKDILRATASTAEIGRSIIAGPGTPPDRLKALRDAFQAMLADPEFVAACKTRGLMIDGGTGEEMDAIVADTLKMPKDILLKVADMMK